MLLFSVLRVVFFFFFFFQEVAKYLFQLVLPRMPHEERHWQSQYVKLSLPLTSSVLRYESLFASSRCNTVESCALDETTASCIN